MARVLANGELQLLLDLLDQAYERKAWHGPNLKGSVRGLDARRACWRPAPGRHSIAEQVLHAAYWKYAARRRLRGDAKGSFPLKGSNWFPVTETLSEAEWRGYLRLLEAEHRSLRSAIADLRPEQLRQTPAGSKVSNDALIQGIAAHDIYHAGQIQLLKRLV
ncbi:MAG TPA: DinB family protein [Isosphaeraceae bacterium]|jgi:uncharacterized damage-inducible protein DinB|nr:DinB family protein [Isosphaeraceae bacterium]